MVEPGGHVVDDGRIRGDLPDELGGDGSCEPVDVGRRLEPGERPDGNLPARSADDGRQCPPRGGILAQPRRSKHGREKTG